MLKRYRRWEDLVQEKYKTGEPEEALSRAVKYDEGKLMSEVYFTINKLKEWCYG